MQLLAQRFDTGQSVRLELAGSVVAAAQPLRAADLVPAESLPWISPGFVDLQVNGFSGREFTDAELSSQDVRRICLSLAASGVVQFCPTLTTQSTERLTRACATLTRACAEFPEVAQRVLGIHLEGPYISAADGPRGAHPSEFCRPPSWSEFQRFQEAAEGRIRLLTLSPEYEKAPAFIEQVASSGVVVSLGHTQATSEQIRAAVDAGARCSTHLGNGAHAVLPRHPNYVWDQLAEDRLWASLIVDGHHLPPEVVKVFVRAKQPERCLLVSDLTGLAGMPPGRYSTGLGHVEKLDDGRLVVAGQRRYLAGASRPLAVGITNVMRFAGVNLATAVAMAAVQPRALLEGASAGDFLAPGAPANFTLFHLPLDAHGRPAGELDVHAVVQHGELLLAKT